MAIDSKGLWEFRAASGSADNGGGFANLDPGTSVDYSNQNSPELVITDGATAGIGSTAFSTANGGLTAAMAGNIVYLQTGTNLVDGWYQFTVIIDTNNATLDRAPDDGVGGVSGADGNVGGALDIFTATFMNDTTLVVPGQTIYIKNDGTMTLTGAMAVTNDGTSVNPFVLEGYNASRGDKPTGNNRPLIAGAANNFYFDNYWKIKYARVTTTTSLGLRADVDSCIENCSVMNSSGSVDRSALEAGSSTTKIYKCEGVSTNGDAVNLAGGSSIFFSYLHDSNIGVRFGGDFCKAMNNLIDTSITGISDGGTAGLDGQIIINNTIYNSTTGISSNDGSGWGVFSNLIDNCTTGASWTTEQGINCFDNNQWSNNGTDVVNVTKGSNALTQNVTLTDPANGDFTLPSGAGAIGAGMQVGTDEGAVGDYKWNIGADQDDVAVGAINIDIHNVQQHGSHGVVNY